MEQTSQATKSQGFSLRAFATFSVVLSTLVLTVTGIVLFFKPAGLMQMLSYRRGWVDLHIVIALIMVVAAVIHLCINWKVLTSYLARTSTSFMRMKKELLVAAVVVIGLSFGSMVGWCPVSGLMKHGGPPKQAGAAQVRGQGEGAEEHEGGMERGEGREGGQQGGAQAQGAQPGGQSEQHGDRDGDGD